MQIPVKTLKSGFTMPVYGLGTWQMGGGSGADTTNDEQDIAAIKAAIEEGITHIDTAEMYGGGHCEELVGQAIKEQDRSKLIITSKVSQGMNEGYGGVLKAAEASLKRLQTDYIDLYLVHSYPGDELLKDVMRAMDSLVDLGLVKNIGVCNLGVDNFRKTQHLTKNKLVCDQVHYSLQVREADIKGVTDFCRQNNVFITAWGPLEKGLLEQGDLLDSLAKKYQKTPYQVALNWIISQPNMITIPKTTDLGHLKENLGALGWELDLQDQIELKDNFPNQQPESHRVRLDTIY